MAEISNPVTTTRNLSGGLRSRKVDFTDEQRQAALTLLQDAYDKRGFKSVSAAALELGVSNDTLRRMLQSAPDGVTLPSAMAILLALDVNLYDYAASLGLTDKIEEEIQNNPMAYPTYRYARNVITDPIDLLLMTYVPEEKRDLARRLVTNALLSTMK